GEPRPCWDLETMKSAAKNRNGWQLAPPAVSAREMKLLLTCARHGLRRHHGSCLRRGSYFRRESCRDSRPSCCGELPPYCDSSLPGAHPRDDTDVPSTDVRNRGGRKTHGTTDRRR